MTYANRYVKIKNEDHLKYVVDKTGMIVDNLDSLLYLIEDGLVIVFWEKFDWWRDRWNIDLVDLERSTKLLEEILIDKPEEKFEGCSIEPKTYIDILSEKHFEDVQYIARKCGFSTYENTYSYPDDGSIFIIFWEDMTYSISYHDAPKEFKEIFIPVLPKPPFKIRNACHPAVRKWLKGQGYSWRDGYDIREHPEIPYLVASSYNNIRGYCSDTIFNESKYPELTLNLEVVGWTTEPIANSKTGRQERIMKLEAELNKLKQIDE